jgi:hypothetical protein
MMFDAPGSDEKLWVWTVVIASLSFPPVCLAGIIAAWVCVALRKPRAAVICSLTPLVPVLVMATAMIWAEYA